MKLIIILFLIPFSLFAQLELSESYQFKPDKQRHAILGTGINTGTFLFVYHKTKDENLAFRAGIIITSFAAIGKEGFDFMTGGEISLADMTYSIGAAILTGLILKKVVTIKGKTIQEQLIKEDITFALENEIFIKSN